MEWGSEGGHFRTFDRSHDPTFAFTLYLRPCAWRYRRYITVCARQGGMISTRLSSSRFLSRYNSAHTRTAWFGQGEQARERAIAALANPLGFGFGSISNSAVLSSLRRDKMPLPHSVYQPDPTCVPIFPKFFLPLPSLSSPLPPPRTNSKSTARVLTWPPSLGMSTGSTVLLPWIG